MNTENTQHTIDAEVPVEFEGATSAGLAVTTMRITYTFQPGTVSPPGGPTLTVDSVEILDAAGLPDQEQQNADLLNGRAQLWIDTEGRGRAIFEANATRERPPLTDEDLTIDPVPMK